MARPNHRCSAAALAIATLACSAPAWADAARGQTLFNGICALCHGTGPGTIPAQRVVAAGGDPQVILNAINTQPQMAFLRSIVSAGDAADIAQYLFQTYGSPPPAPPSPPSPAITGTAVEFYHAQLDHYFVTAIPAEIAALDTGAQQGWARTGATFNVWATLADAPAGATPVCRVYIPPSFGNSHFYSASPAECAEVRVRFPQFVYEADEVMAVRLPDPATGACASDTVPVYRLWNSRVDANHRYTTDLGVRQTMIGRGYVSEGYGPQGVVFCAPI